MCNILENYQQCISLIKIRSKLRPRRGAAPESVGGRTELGVGGEKYSNRYKADSEGAEAEVYGEFVFARDSNFPPAA